MNKKDQARDKRYKKKYGIGLEEYNKMLKEQNGLCALCEKPPKNTPLHVEHNHRTGKIRALCCFFCNRRRIGQLNLKWAKAVYEYLLKYDEVV